MAKMKWTAFDGQETSKDVATAPARRSGPLAILPGGAARDVQGTWPSWKETYLTTLMVFIMVVISMVFFAVVDYGLGLALNFVLGI